MVARRFAARAYTISALACAQAQAALNAPHAFRASRRAFHAALRIAPAASLK